MWKRLTASPSVRQGLGRLLAGYLRLVGRTNRLVIDPPDLFETRRSDFPGVLAVWHGQHFIVPLGRPDWMPCKVIISRSNDGDINAIASEQFGIGAIRASGGRNAAQTKRRGGARGALEAVRAIGEGFSVLLTADVPKGPARVAGSGIVTIAKHARRPILPVAMATSRYLTLPSWDRAALNLPFGVMSLVVGPPIEVPADADDDVIEAKRLEVEAALNVATRRAYELVGERSRRQA